MMCSDGTSDERMQQRRSTARRSITMTTFGKRSARRSMKMGGRMSVSSVTSISTLNDEPRYIASTPWGIRLEKILVPWTPKSIPSLARFLLWFSLLQTLPFAVTRIRTGRWMLQFYQMHLLNFFLKTFGFNPVFGGDVTSVPYPKDEENPDRPGIDFAFALHMSAGVLWIIFGSMQIILSNKVSRRFHSRFGYVAAGVFLIHAIGALNNLRTDIVHHHTATKVLLSEDVVSSACYIMLGIRMAIKGDKGAHRDMMMRGYLQSIEGSGTIRFTAFVYWVVGRLMKEEFRVHIDTGSCQSQYVTASAANCVFPYIFRLQGMRMLTLYFHVLYLRTPEKRRDDVGRRVLREEVTNTVISYVLTVFGIGLLFLIESYDSAGRIQDAISSFLGQGEWLQFSVFGVYSTYLIWDRYNHTHRRLTMTMRASKPLKRIVESADHVQMWASLHGLDDDFDDDESRKDKDQ